MELVLSETKTYMYRCKSCLVLDRPRYWFKQFTFDFLTSEDFKLFDFPILPDAGCSRNAWCAL